MTDEDLIGALQKLALEVETLNGRFDTSMRALEQKLDDRLKVVENQVSQIGSGLAVVLNRSEGNRSEAREAKKKPTTLSGGHAGLPNVPAESLPTMRPVLPTPSSD